MSDIINGVPRELLERIACEVTPKTHQEMFDSAKDFAAAIKELRALLPAQPQASAAQSEPVEDRGWPDRDYWCKCCGCGEMFTGHKRQVICRICTEESAAQSAPAGEREAFEAAYQQYWGHFDDLRLGIDEQGRYRSARVNEALVMFQAGAAWHRTQAGVPEGWKLVPVEPTEEMLDAGYDAYGQGHFTPSIIDCYRAMLAAAPAQPAAQGVEPHQINCNAVSQYPAGKCNCGKGE